MEMADSLQTVKSSVYAVQVELLEGIASDAQLLAAGKLLTRSEYADVVTERTFINLCGYPLCTHPLPENFPRKGRYHISLREHKVYDLQETRLFCSSDCLISSQSFAASLPLDRDHSEKTLELAAAFHGLGLRDVDQHTEASSSAMEIDEDICKSALKQDSESRFHHQTSPLAIEIGEGTHAHVHQSELDIPEVEEITTKQPQELKPGTFLLIREQAEIKVDDFCTAGPSNAIEGYIPQREFHHNKLSDHEKDEMAALSSKSESKEKQGDRPRKKERERSGSSKKKQRSVCKAKNSDTGVSSGLETEFSSRVLVDQAMPPTSEARCSGELVSRCSAAEKNFTSCIIMNEKKSMQTLGRHCPKKKQNRVSWADQNNLKLVEESSSSFVSGGSGTLKDLHDMPALMKGQRDQDNVSEFLCLGKPTVLVEESNGFLLGQERSFCEEEQENAQVYNSRNDNLECAKALVAALTKAAEAVAHGDADSSEAVARAGISILPNYEEAPNQHLDHARKEQKESEKGLADDVENADPKDCWYSAPPKDFKPELSTFGTLWMALDGWISAASIAYVYGRDLNQEDDFTFINGKEYLRQVTIPNGVSAEIERTLAGCISRALPGLVETLRFPVPVSTLELSLGRFLRTMSFISAIPPFSSKQWQLVVLLLLDALSIHRLPALRTRFLNGRPVIQKVLDSSNITEAEYEVFRDLVLPMGMLPEFAAHCGG